MKAMFAIPKARTTAALIAALVLAVSSGASAWYTTPAMSGHAWPPAAHECFTHSWSKVEPQSCSFTGTKRWIIPLTVNANGKTRRILITASAEQAATALTCVGIKNNGNNTGWVTNTVSWTGSSYTQKDLGSVGTIGVNETAHADCGFGSLFGGAQAGAITSVQWSSG